MTKNERQLYERRNLISSLMKIEHGDYKGYIPIGLQASQAEPELFAHFIAYNNGAGKVRDTKVAFPVIALRGVSKAERNLAENAVAHLMLLDPRNLVKAYNFSKEMTASGMSIRSGFRDMLEDGIHQYLEARQSNSKFWDRTVLTHRGPMKRLYRLSHHKPTARAQAILFDGEYPEKSIFWKIANLSKMPPREAASIILTENIPFEVVVGSMSNIKNPDVILALLEGATANQVVNNAKMFERLGIKSDPALKAAFDAALGRAKTDKRLNVLKAGVAAEKVESLGADLLNLQKEATKQLGSIEGNWLVLGDASGSMSTSMELAKKIAAIITERVLGKVWLIFFNTVPTPFEVTGKTYYQINDMTKNIKAGGGTSVGCGVEYLYSRKEEVDGIAIVSDGGDNTGPLFGEAYRKYSQFIGKEPTVYFFEVDGDTDSISKQVPGIEKFNLKQQKVDYNSLPNMVQTLRVNKYSLLDEIMATPLLTMDMVLHRKEDRE